MFWYDTFNKKYTITWKPLLWVSACLDAKSQNCWRFHPPPPPAYPFFRCVCLKNVTSSCHKIILYLFWANLSLYLIYVRVYSLVSVSYTLIIILYLECISIDSVKRQHNIKKKCKKIRDLRNKARVIVFVAE